jgi:hypothetical protein
MDEQGSKTTHVSVLRCVHVHHDHASCIIHHASCISIGSKILVGTSHDSNPWVRMCMFCYCPSKVYVAPFRVFAVCSADHVAALQCVLLLGWRGCVNPNDEHRAWACRNQVQCKETQVQ